MSGTILTLYYLILGILALYGLHRLMLVVTYWRTRFDPPELPPMRVAGFQPLGKDT